LPSPITQSVLDTRGKPAQINIFDPGLWEKNQWSVYSPELLKMLEKQTGSPVQAKTRQAILQSVFSEHLQRAERLQSALPNPFH